MSKKLKGISTSVQIPKKPSNTPASLDICEHPIFCFKFITNNNKHSLGYFKTKQDREIAMGALMDKIVRLSEYSFKVLLNFGKNFSLETIPYEQFSIQLKVFGIELSKDTKLYVFRFFNQNYRAICYKSKSVPTLLHIVAFDFDFSAYNHS